MSVALKSEEAVIAELVENWAMREVVEVRNDDIEVRWVSAPYPGSHLTLQMEVRLSVNGIRPRLVFKRTAMSAERLPELFSVTLLVRQCRYEFLMAASIAMWTELHEKENPRKV